jgi:hypothetical protein
MSNFEIGTECETVDKKTTQYIERKISQKFFDVCSELHASKVPHAVILQGLSITLAKYLVRIEDTQNSQTEIGKIIDEIGDVLNHAIERDVNFPNQATALAITTQHVLGIRPENFE